MSFKKIAQLFSTKKAKPTTPSVSHQTTHVDLHCDIDDYSALLKGFFRPGNFDSIYFARCCGENIEVLDEEKKDFLTYIVNFKTFKNVTQPGKEKAFAWFEREVVQSLNSLYMEMHFSIAPTYGEELRVSRDDLERLRRIQAHCLKNPISQLRTLFPDLDLVQLTFEHLENHHKETLKEVQWWE